MGSRSSHASCPRSVIDRLATSGRHRCCSVPATIPARPKKSRVSLRSLRDLHIIPSIPCCGTARNHALDKTQCTSIPSCRYNDNWHTDVPFSTATPPLAGKLASKRLPPVGGDTQWSSCSSAYEALSDPLRRFPKRDSRRSIRCKEVLPARNSGKNDDARLPGAIRSGPWPTSAGQPSGGCVQHPVSGRKGWFFKRRIYDSHQRARSRGKDKCCSRFCVVWRMCRQTGQSPQVRWSVE